MLLAPLLFIVKIMFFMMIFGAFASGVAHKRGRHHRNRTDESAGWSDDWSEWRARWDRSPNRRRRSRVERYNRPEPRQTETDRFEDWHRMAHAREEVDSWVNPQVDITDSTPADSGPTEA